MAPFRNHCIDSDSAYAILLSKPARGSTDKSRLFGNRWPQQTTCAFRQMLRRTSAAVATSRVGHRQPGPLWSKRKSSRPAHQFALPLKAVKSPHQHGECGNRSTLLKKSKREERKGNRGGNCLKGCMLAVPRCSGGLVPNISGSMGNDCGPLRRPSSAQKAVPFRRLQDGGDSTGLIMNESSRSKGVKNVLSLQVARERTRQAKAASDRQISERSNQRLLERLEAENAQLRDCVVELMLEIQALHDGAK